MAKIQDRALGVLAEAGAAVELLERALMLAAGAVETGDPIAMYEAKGLVTSATRRLESAVVY